MKQSNLWIILLLILLPAALIAQKKPVKKAPVQKPKVEKPVVQQKPDPKDDEQKVRDIIAFLEYMLNTLGSSGTSTRDKEVLITESYSKIFRDSKVQIEDDLDEERDVITNKDVIAYLKDVNFFFYDVKFEFDIKSIKGSTLPSGQHFYKVTTNRNLKGTTTEHTSVNNVAPRFIEINYNPRDQDLKIVSIYTKEFNEKEALQNWWRELSFEWQSIFKKKVNLRDSASLSDIKKVMVIQSLDISGNQYLQSFEPLSQLSKLEILNVSNTDIPDLNPIRNLTELVDINLSNTKISDLSPLKYSSKLKRLNIAKTNVSDISVATKMPGLQELDMRSTRVGDLSPLASLTGLQKLTMESTKIADLTPIETTASITHLNISNTSVNNLEPLKQLKNLQELDADSTQIKSLQMLKDLENLRVLSINHTSVSDLLPMQKMTKLQKIYCDRTLIKHEAAQSFMTTNPSVLVIFDSEDLKFWWNALSNDWQQVLSKPSGISMKPTKEELAKVPLLDSINLSGRSSIQNLDPLRNLKNLKTLIASKTSISDISAIKSNVKLQHLDISETEVKDISSLASLPLLKVVKADGSKIENIELLDSKGLKVMYVDGVTSINNLVAKKFLEKNPDCLLVYKTEHLKKWWSSLPTEWAKIFKEFVKRDERVTREELHALIERESLIFSDVAITNLVPLAEFIQLKELHFSGTAMITISPVESIQSLKSLHATNSPIQTIESLSTLTELEDLDISNTPVEDVYELWKLKKLKKLNCAGTQIRRLDAMEKLEKLEYLDCSNTNVNKLSPLDYLPLTVLKCYNTKVPSRVIENFKASHPNCTVTYYR